jgi:uncharacterized membrane protein YhaH (DUF805 family)
MNTAVGSLDRRGYLVWNSILVLVAIFFGSIIDATKAHHTGVYWTLLRIVFSVLFVLVFVIAVVRRLNNVGWNVWLVLVSLVPIVGQLFWLTLFFVPPKKK